MLASRLSVIAAMTAIVTLAGISPAGAMCKKKEGSGECVSRLATNKCTKSRFATLCKAKEAAKLLPKVLAWLAKKAKAALSGAGDAARDFVARGIARVMGDPNKVSDPTWTGEFCTKDAYFSRFKNDLSHDGITNYGVVDEGKLYRGSQPFTDGQPDESGKKGNGFDTLKSLGIKCRILLRTTPITDGLRSESRELKKRGIKFFHLPASVALFGPPTRKILGFTIPDKARILFERAVTKSRDKFMSIVRSGKYGPCYLSCQSGRDRTGILIGWYRAVVQGWKPDKIFREQEDCKFEPKEPFLYFRRLFCRWYKAKFGSEATCDAVLAK